MPNPFTTGGQIAQTSVNEPEKIFEFTKGQRTVLPDAPAAAPSQSAAMPDIYAPSAQPQRQPMNALSRGAPAGFGSGLGGPVKVGSQRPMGMKLLERAARRRDPRAIQQLAGIEAQTSDNAEARNQRWAEMIFGAGQDQARDTRRMEHDDALWTKNANRDDTLWDRKTGREDEIYDRNKVDEAGLWERNNAEDDRRHTRDRAEQLDDEKRKGEESRKTYTLPDPLTGKPHTGHFMTGSGIALPAKPAEKTPEQIKAEEDYFKAQGLQIQESKDSRGRTWERPKAEKAKPLQYFDPETNRKVDLDPEQYELGEDGKPRLKKKEGKSDKEAKRSWLNYK